MDIFLPLPGASSSRGLVHVLVNELEKRSAEGEGVDAREVEIHVSEGKLLVSLRVGG